MCAMRRSSVSNPMNPKLQYHAKDDVDESSSHPLATAMKNSAETTGSEMDKLKNILERVKTKGHNSRKARTLSKTGMWDELEQLYKDLEQREKDYQIAVEIGKMLLEKNKELSDKNDIVKKQFEESLQQRDTQIQELLSMVEQYNDKKQEMQNEISSLRLQVACLQTGNQDTETKAFLMYEEISKVQENNQKYKSENRNLKQKNNDLIEEIEKYKQDINELKNIERNLRKQLKNNQMETTTLNITQSQSQVGITDERKKLEEEMRSLGNSYKKMESIMEEMSMENLALKEAIEVRDQEKEQLQSMIYALRQANNFLEEQEEERRRILEERSHEVENLKNELEDMMIKQATDSFDLRKELIDTALSHKRSDSFSSDHESGSVISASASTSALNRSRRSSQTYDRSPSFSHSNFTAITLGGNFNENSVDLNSMDKESLIEEIKNLRRRKQEESMMIGNIHELRDRLHDAELKNLTRTMRNVYYFEDILHISNSIIDSVVKDTRRKILDKRPDHETFRLISDLMFENCKLRKLANDYAEAINQGTIEKLDKFKKYLDPGSGSSSSINDDSKSSDSTNQRKKFWNVLPLFDFFSGWQQPQSQPQQQQQ